MHREPTSRPAGVGPLYLVGGLHDERARTTFHAWLAERLARRAGPCLLLPAGGDQDGIRAARSALAGTGLEPLVLPVLERSEAEHPGVVGRVPGAAGLYLGGGDAARLVATVAGTPLEGALRRAWESGLSVAAVSAGAGALGACAAHCPDHGAGWGPGLGWLDAVVIMPHCDQPGRLAELRRVAADRGRVGLGLAGDTWLSRDPDGRCRVHGARWAYLIVPRAGRARGYRLGAGAAFTWPDAAAELAAG